jgi:lipoprotein-releasing system permease protein
VIKIFVTEAVVMGVFGTLMGLGLGAILIKIMSGIYMGGPVGFFPITFRADLFLQSFLLGFIITVFAGYFPARKAANVDPVSILRK